MAADRVRVGVEQGAKRTFASALDFPGWTRSARDEAGAIGRLDDSYERYARVAARAGLELPRDPVFEVVERVPGDATTDFGAPSGSFTVEAEALDRSRAERLAGLLQAAWDELAAVAAHSPESLTKGPRGGGRDRTKMLEHVRDAEYAYVRKIGISLTPAKASPERLRAAVLEAVARARGSMPTEWKWSIPYFVRRTAWHALDHAWEMEDRTPR